MAEFQIVVETKGDKTFFVTTNEPSEVNDKIDVFRESTSSLSIKVYQFDDVLGYDLVYSETKEVKRMIGFCRG